MNYRHGYHAGNFADVVKHLALTAILLHLKKKDSPFAVFDSHAGRGSYDLKADEARKTGEAEEGIARLRDVTAKEPALAAYLELARAGGPDIYPGSPLIAAKLMRASDRLVALEKHPEEFALLEKNLSPWRKASAELTDGYVRLPKLLPPPERRGLVLIDPPYEQPDEFEKTAELVAAAYKRFATGIYLIWFPIKSAAQADIFCGQILNSGATRAVRIDIDRGGEPEGKLTRTGLVVLNPPFVFASELQNSLMQIVPLLSTGDKQASYRIMQLAGD